MEMFLKTEQSVIKYTEATVIHLFLNIKNFGQNKQN